MMRIPTTVQIFLAVFCGAFVGTVVALDQSPALWWIGLLAGGLVGYLAYSPVQIIRAIPQAGRVAGKAALKTMRVSVSWLGNLAIALFFDVILCLITTFYISFLFFILAVVLPLSLVGALGGSIFFSIGATVVIQMWAIGRLINSDNSPLSNRDTFQDSIQELNPFRFFAWVLRKALPKVLIWVPKIIFYYLPIGLWRLAKSFGVFAKTFSVTLFKLIHSDERLLCSVDAAIGVVIGYFLHNALAGALIGGVFGVINYELIAKRWLKLAPQRS